MLSVRLSPALNRFAALLGGMCLVLSMTACGGSAAAANTNGGGSGIPPNAVGGSTTLQAETANNTSTSDNFAGQLNGLSRPANVSKVDTRSLLYTGSTTKIYAGLQGWFGEPSHMDVRYQSNDPQQVRKQVEDMQSRGIQGAILDWFGTASNSSAVRVNNTAMALRTSAEAHPGFEFAIMEDGGALSEAAKANGCDVTSQIISDLSFVNSQFVPSPAYMRFSGRPVIFFFGVDAFYIDWGRVQSEVTNHPLLLFRGQDGLTRPISDGGFQWEDISADPFHPASPNPFDPALAPQAAFYTAAQKSERLAVGSVYKGFNDSLAPWGIDRFVHGRCGQTWLDTFTEIAKFYSSSKQLPALQIVTWNDYDEGSAMEMGIDNCVFVQTTISGNILSWTVGGGSENTVDHYTVFSSADGKNLTRLADVAAGTHSVDLSSLGVKSGAFLFVKATGKPSIQNKMSPAIAFRPGDQPPRANLAVSQTGPLTFSASTVASTDPDGSVASSTIDFGDGTVVSGPTANHTYASIGTFDVTATVVDNGGASAATIQRVSAKSAQPGVTIASPAQGETINWPTPNFSASANGNNPITLMRVLVDGTQLYAINGDTVLTPLKVYTGNHHVEVQAVDSAGATSSAAIDISAEPNEVPPIPAIEVRPLPQVGPNTLLFCGANWQAPNRFVNSTHWAFSDGGQAFGPGPVHTFPTPGTFSTTETVINEFGAVGSLGKMVNASGVPAALRPGTAVHVRSPETQKLDLPLRIP
jgi:PKD repeat protein